MSEKLKTLLAKILLCGIKEDIDTINFELAWVNGVDDNKLRKDREELRALKLSIEKYANTEEDRCDDETVKKIYKEALEESRLAVGKLQLQKTDDIEKDNIHGIIEILEEISKLFEK